MPAQKLSFPAPLWFRGLPISGTALDFVKICAAVFMVIDHIDHVFWNYNVFGMYLIGRGAFPLFCFAAAAFMFRAPMDKARDQCVKLLFLAVLCEPVSELVRGPLINDMPANVIFTLAAGCATTLIMPALRPLLRHLLFAGAVASVWIGETVEFGLMGIMLVPAFCQVMRGDKQALPWLGLLLLTINAGGLGDALQTARPGWWLIPLLSGLCAIALPVLVLDISRTLEGSGRLLPRHALHVFYPGHLAVLGLLKWLLT